MTESGFTPVFAPLGDGAIMITLGDSIDREVNRRVHACVQGLRGAALPEVLDVVPAYSSLAVHYDACAADAKEITARVSAIVGSVIEQDVPDARSSLVLIPVRYDGADLSAVAAAAGLTVEQVVERHSAVEYYVYMMGFSPGFAYLGDLDPILQLPRRESPRPRVPRGSVAIAGSQTAVYPHATPGGWHLIGSTELPLFDATRNPPALLHAGDRVRFERMA